MKAKLNRLNEELRIAELELMGAKARLEKAKETFSNRYKLLFGTD